MKKLIIAMLLAAGVAHAQTEWVQVAKSTTMEYSIKAGSSKLVENDSGVKVIAALGKAYNNQTRKVDPSIWYVALSHCKLGRGNFVVTDVLGNFQSEHQFVFGIGSVAATIAETLCAVANLDKDGEKNKSFNGKTA